MGILYLSFFPISTNFDDIYITNRTEKSAESIAAEFGISAIAWSDFRRDLNQFDVIICAAQADHYLISKKDLKTKELKLSSPLPKFIY